MNRLLITICGRAGSKGFKNKNLKVFCGKPLVYYSLSAAELFIKNHPELTVDIALNTDSEDLAKLVAAEYPEVVYLPRGAELGGDRVPKMAVYQDSLRRMEARAGQPYDWHMDLDITSPLRTAADIAEERGLRCTVGNLLSSDTFYDDDKTANAAWIKMGVLGIEMEAAALYLNAMRAGKKALTICTVSDHVITGEETTAEERQNSFREMMELALEVAVRS